MAALSPEPSPSPASPSEPASDARGQPGADAAPDRAGIRVVAVFALLVWWVLMYGVVDLSTPFAAAPQDLQFYDVYMLEAGWGLMYTVLLGVPALALLWRPSNLDPAVQHLVVGASMTITAIATPAPGHLLPAALAVGLGLALLASATGSPRPPGGYTRAPQGLWWVPAAVALLAAAPAAVYALACLQAARDGSVSDTTNGLDHWPAQGAFALAVVLVAVQGVCARGRLPAWCAAVSGAWFGVFSMVYPGHAGSVGLDGGVVAITMSLAYLTSWELARARTHR